MQQCKARTGAVVTPLNQPTKFSFKIISSLHFLARLVYQPKSLTQSFFVRRQHPTSLALSSSATLSVQPPQPRS